MTSNDYDDEVIMIMMIMMQCMRSPQSLSLHSNHKSTADIDIHPDAGLKAFVDLCLGFYEVMMIMMYVECSQCREYSCSTQT